MTNRIHKKFSTYERCHRKADPRERPPAFPVEETFDLFVREFGGEKISDRISNKSQMPLNADYIFPDQNVIAELKTLEGIFSGREGFSSFRQAFIDADLPIESMMRVLIHGEPIPEKVQTLIRTRVRRGLEQRIKTARKQLRFSKGMFGNNETASLILLAIDQLPLFGHQLMIAELAGLMGSNYRDEHTDGVVYLNPNTPTRVRPNGMEYAGWFPFYRDDEINERLSAFVNLLGNRWLNFSGNRSGETNPILKLESFEEIMFALDSV